MNLDKAETVLADSRKRHIAIVGDFMPDQYVGAPVYRYELRDTFREPYATTA